jgi:hypothetical protein
LLTCVSSTRAVVPCGTAAEVVTEAVSVDFDGVVPGSSGEVLMVVGSNEAVPRETVRGGGGF